MSEALPERLHRPLNRLLLAVPPSTRPRHTAFSYLELQGRKGLATRFLYCDPDGKNERYPWIKRKERATVSVQAGDESEGERTRISHVLSARSPIELHAALSW